MEIPELTRVVFDTMIEGILIIDADGIVQYINPAYTSITGVDCQTIVGQPLLSIRPGSRLTNVVKSGKRVMRAPRFYDGVAYMTNMYPIRDANNVVIGGVSTVIEANDVFALNKEWETFQANLRMLSNYIKVEKTAKYTFDQIVYADPASSACIELARRIAAKGLSTVITGESGTGKELYANSIHNESQRREFPFVALNCAAFDANLLESELFGYEEGAFTGAKKGGKSGMFEIADGGTIFLDEISEMDLQIQSRLLRTLQEKTIRRVGGKLEISVDVRIIAATNKRLEDMVREKRFREDLYYRIAVIPLNLPPLRERRGDIIPLAEHFLDAIVQHEKTPLVFESAVLPLLASYDWPGNIRELKNSVEFAAFHAEGHVIDIAHLPPRIPLECSRKGALRMPCLKERIRAFEMREIRQAVATYGDSVEGKKKAAAQLGISLATLYNKLEP